jgi:hypothetical protein
VPGKEFTATCNPAINRVANQHPRLCQAKLAGGRKCGQWALKGIQYCKFHGGAAIKRLREKRNVDDPRTNDVARIRKYKKLGATLEQFVAELLTQPEQEQLDLFEELALMRSFVDESTSMFAAACALPANNAKRTELIVCAGGLMKQALDDVRVMSKTASDIFANGKDKFSVHSLHDIVQQIKRMVHNCFGHCEIELEEFEKQLRLLQLPKIGADGTTITPDQDVIEMDSMIPRKEQGELQEYVQDELANEASNELEVDATMKAKD